MEVTYGADKNGLICGYLFAAGQPGVPVGLEDAVRWLRQPAPEGRGDFVWLHFDLTNAATERLIETQLDVVPEFFQALREGSRSTRIEDASDTLVAVVNDVAFEFSFDPSEIATLWANVGPRMAVTAR
jgi:zinc transporter